MEYTSPVLLNNCKQNIMSLSLLVGTTVILEILTCNLLICTSLLYQTRLRGYNTFFMLNSTEHEISTAHKKLKYRQINKFLALSLSDVVFIMLINFKMPTIVGILTFMSRIYFVLSLVEHEKSFISSGPDVRIHKYTRN